MATCTYISSGTDTTVNSYAGLITIRGDGGASSDCDGDEPRQGPFIVLGPAITVEFSVGSPDEKANEQ